MSRKGYDDIGRVINQFIQELKNTPAGGFTNVKNGVDEAARQFKEEVKNAAQGFKVHTNSGEQPQPRQQWETPANNWQRQVSYPQKKTIPG